MRILVDYRPALRERTGVGEYIHHLVSAHAAAYPSDKLGLFTSSWRDRPAPELAGGFGPGPVQVVDRRVPVRVLNYAWHRLAWPPVEWLAGAWDVAHSPHPLLLPARAAARVVTIHDLFFLDHRDAVRGEVRRDYADLVARHAQEADAVVTSTEYGRALVADRLGVPAARIHVCPPGAPRWQTLGARPNRPVGGYLLFVGTLEPRKNLSVLLDAFARLLDRHADVPPLVVAGRATPEAAPLLARMAAPPLAGRVEYRGYVPDGDREALFAGAALLAIPSLDEGFGLPALEAMAAGVPVVASTRGALPEVLRGSGLLVEALDVVGLCDAMATLLFDEARALACAEAGLARARTFTWERTARAVHGAYTDACSRRSAAR